jgi:hypothetical protein
LVEVFKILRGFENRIWILKSSFRWSGMDVGKFKFASRVCDEWNRLGDGIVSAETVNAFKARLDRHLRNVRGYL